MPTTPSAAQAHAQKIAEEYVPSDDRKQAVLSEDHPPPPVDEEKEVVRLAKLATVQYEREREAAAATLKIRVAVVDKLVKAACQGASPGQGRKVELQEIDPWPDPVDGAVLLDEISTAIYEHIHLSPQQADTCALYSVYAHGYHVFRVAPRLGVRAPTRECGKTELLRRLKLLARRTVSTENLTVAVLFRMIDELHPTVFMDEVDNLLADGKSELLTILNGGHVRDGTAYRLVGDHHELRAFSTFGPLIYGMKGTPPDTFNSRSIPIEMKRATPAQWRALKSLEDGEAEDFRLRAMARKAARWVSDNVAKLTSTRPHMAKLVNRAADNWRPLFAVADVAGGKWPERVRAAALAAAKVTAVPVDEEELFSAIKGIFQISTLDYVLSVNLASKLAEIETGPWAEYGKTGKSITQNAVARLLKPFGITPSNVDPDNRLRGYCLSQFDDVFASYIAPPSQNEDSNRSTVQKSKGLEQVEREQPFAKEAGEQLDTLKNPNNDGLLNNRTVEEPKNGRARREAPARLDNSLDREFDPNDPGPLPAFLDRSKRRVAS